MQLLAVAAIGIIMGSLIGAVVTSAHKVWHSLQALGGIAFAYCFSINLIEIQVSNNNLIFTSTLLCSLQLELLWFISSRTRSRRRHRRSRR